MCNAEIIDPLPNCSFNFTEETMTRATTIQTSTLTPQRKKTVFLAPHPQTNPSVQFP